MPGTGLGIGNGSSDGWASYEVAPGVTDHQAYGLGIYCYFNANPNEIADDATKVPTRTGVPLHDAMDVSLDGTGTIGRIVNSSGATVNSANTVADLVTNRETSRRFTDGQPGHP